MGAVLVKNADRMMTSANPLKEGVEIAFADGFKGLIPFASIPGIGGLSNLIEIELPNPYQVILRNSRGEVVELPWDFTRHYCDAAYQPKIEVLAMEGRKSIGARIRKLRETVGMTQEKLAAAASIARVTLVRVEGGDQSPRYETLVSLAKALRQPLAELLGNEPTTN